MNKLKQLLIYLNEQGIPLPLIRDNKTGRGSISYTFVWLSGTLVLFGLVGKWSHYLDIDLSNAITFFGVSSGLYWGRAIDTNKGSISLKENNKEKEE